MWPFPRKADFYGMLLAQAEKVEEGMVALEDFTRNPSTENGDKVRAIEKQADELRRLLIEELNQAFVTPMDREDIFSLSRVIDDVVDYAKSTVEEMTLFEVGSNPHIRKMAETLRAASRDLSSAVRLMKNDSKTAHTHLIAAKKTENAMERFYREALVDLFKNADVLTIIKLREIYRHLSNAADRGDEAADIIGDILVKMS